MAIFQTRIRHVSLTWSPFSAETMSTIGTVWLDHKLSRIRQAIDSTDSPAKPLRPNYRIQKTTGRRVPPNTSIKYKGKGIRDWTLRGWSLASAKVKAASEDRVTLGFIDAKANQIIKVQRRSSEMWSNSPSDIEAMSAVVRASLTQHITRQFRKST